MTEPRTLQERLLERSTSWRFPAYAALDREVAATLGAQSKLLAEARDALKQAIPFISGCSIPTIGDNACITAHNKRCIAAEKSARAVHAKLKAASGEG